LFAVQIN
jgi:hypothetical protein